MRFIFRAINPSRRACGSVGFAVGYDEGDGGLENDFDVEPESPVFDIPNVFLDALLHFPNFLGFAPATAHLRIAGDAWQTEMPHHVFVDDVAVLFGVGEHVGLSH